MKPTKPLKLQRSYKAKFSRTGSLLVTLSRDVVVWDVERRAKQYRVHPFSHPSDCSIHPNETQIVVKNTAGKIALLDAQDGALVCFLDSATGNEGSNILYSSCGEYVVDGSWGGHLRVRSATSGGVVFQKIFPGEMIVKIAHSNDNDTWCEFPAFRSHFVVGVQAPPNRRHNGATRLSASRRQFIGGLLAPLVRRR